MPLQGPWTPVLDDVNRADEALATSANWDDWLTGGYSIVSNEVDPANANDNGAVWTAGLTNNHEVKVQLSNIVATTFVAVVFRGNPTGTGFNGTEYNFGVSVDNGDVRIEYFDGASGSNISGTTNCGGAVSNGDWIGARAFQDWLQGWVFRSGRWRLCSQVKHTALMTASNTKIGLYQFANSTSGTKVDNFGGGAITPQDFKRWSVHPKYRAPGLRTPDVFTVA